MKNIFIQGSYCDTALTFLFHNLYHYISIQFLLENMPYVSGTVYDCSMANNLEYQQLSRSELELPRDLGCLG